MIHSNTYTGAGMSIRAFATKTLAFSLNESLVLVLLFLLAIRTPLEGIEILSDFDFKTQ